MKFCYFTVFARHDQYVAMKQMKSLKDAGFDVSMVVCDGMPDAQIDGIQITSINQVSRIGSYFRRLVVFPFLLYRKLKLIDADVYQTCDVDSLLLCYLLKLKGKKIVFNLLEEHPYTLYSKLRFPQLINHIIVGMAKFWMQFVLKRVDAIFTVSPDFKDYLYDWGIKKVEILGNYPIYRDDYFFSFDDYLNRPNRIIYFGAIYEISRQEVFFDALMSCDDVCYLLAGDFGIGNYKNTLEEHPMWRRIDFINRFEKEDLSNILNDCSISNVLRDFSCTGYPNGSYGIIKLFESMEAGLPIICSNVKVYREMMNEYPCGLLVDPNNSEEISMAIHYLLENKNEAYRMGQEGRRAVKEKYNWNSESVNYINKIKSIINNTSYEQK